MSESLSQRILDSGLLCRGDRLLVGLSGGADSVALLHALLALAPRLSLHVVAAHLDHGIREESRSDLLFVENLCRQWGVPLSVERVDVPALARTLKGGVEEAGRMARRAFLERAADDLGADLIALGHHRGDQAETFLHRLLRGSALPGLGGMRPRSGRYVRPLLDCSRREITDYLHGLEIPFLVDASNLDPVYTRNRIRHQLIPLLEEFNPRVEEHLCRLCRRIAAEEEVWDQRVEEALQGAGTFSRGEGRLDREALLSHPEGLRLRLLRRAVECVRGDLLGIGAEHLERLDLLLREGPPQGELHLPGLWAGRRYGRLWLRHSPPEPSLPWEVAVGGPGVYSLPVGGVLEVSFLPDAQGEGEGVVEFDPVAVPFPFVVRTPLPGDRFRPSGCSGRKKLKDFFIDAKVAKEERRAQALVVGEEILWLLGGRRCEGMRPAPGKGALRLRWKVDC